MGSVERTSLNAQQNRNRDVLNWAIANGCPGAETILNLKTMSVTNKGGFVVSLFFCSLLRSFFFSLCFPGPHFSEKLKREEGAL